MEMIPVDEAIRIAAEAYPDGPEALAERMSISVRYSKMTGCDGWCIQNGGTPVVRINESMARSRQKFTLAHEIGHIVLGVPAPIGERYADFLTPDSTEERLVNDFASCILIPDGVICESVNSVPVTMRAIKKLAEDSKVSVHVAALRVVRSAQKVGLKGAALVQYRNGVYEWKFSNNIVFDKDELRDLNVRVSEAHPIAFRYDGDSGLSFVACYHKNPQFDSELVFVNCIPTKQANCPTDDEQITQLEQVLFAGRNQFRNQMQGCFGSTKNKIKDMKIEDAVKLFYERYKERWKGEEYSVFVSHECVRYVTLKLKRLLRTADKTSG